MGASYKYTCPKCDYKALVGGGVSEGFMAVMLTIDCRDCKDLYDVGLLQRKFVDSPGGGSKMVYEQSHIQCPEKPQHRWDLFRRSCPRCGTRLDVDRERPELLWD